MTIGLLLQGGFSKDPTSTWRRKSAANTAPLSCRYRRYSLRRAESYFPGSSSPLCVIIGPDQLETDDLIPESELDARLSSPRLSLSVSLCFLGISGELSGVCLVSNGDSLLKHDVTSKNCKQFIFTW